MKKSRFNVAVISDCIMSYTKKKIPEMLEYYKSKGFFNQANLFINDFMQKIEIKLNNLCIILRYILLRDKNGWKKFN